MSVADRKMALRLAQEAMNAETKASAKLAAIELQRLRDLANKTFPEFNNRLSIITTSWLRPIEWEVYRGRSGKGQHPTGHGVDWVFTHPTASRAQINEVMQWAWEQYKDSWPGGLARLAKGGHYTFIHTDHRGYPARWQY